MHGGIISGNTAGITGGGVSIDAGTFTKTPAMESETSGIIYGDDGSVNANKANLDEVPLTDPMGHAVYVLAGPKTRETTVLPDQHLDSGEAGGWAD
jgi:hypothetical protein